MKRLLFILCFALGFSLILQAKLVTTTEAGKAALAVMQAKAPGFSGSVASIAPVTDNGITTYYIVNFSPRGWALIAADDEASPLLGYGTTGSFTQKNMPDNARNWLSLYSSELKEIIKENTGVRHKGWSNLSVASRAAEDVVSPLISVHWNQPSPYNKYCPSNSKGTALVGCVAVAMAQAMSVYQYPTRPKGNHGYTSANFGTIYVDYDKQADYNWSDIMSGANNKDEVARLLYHCGVAIDMDYGVDGSGAWTKDVLTALQTYFSYPGSVTYVTRAGYSGNWKELLLNELKNGRPIIFGANNAAGNAGHEFNLDGYDGSFFHVNWGWGGALEGYFDIDNLGNTQTDIWTKYQDAIIGLARPGNGPYDIMLDANYVSESQPVGTKIGNIAVKSTASSATYDYTIVGPYSPITHQNVEAPFEVKDGALLTTKVLSKSDAEEWKITITATDKSTKLSTNKSFVIYVVNASDLESPAKSVTLVYDKAKKVLTMSSTKTISYALTTSDSYSAAGTITKDTPISIDLKDVTARTCKLKLSNVILSKVINIILNK